MALELGSRNLNTAQLDFEAFVVTFWLLAQKFDLTGKLLEPPYYDELVLTTSAEKLFASLPC